MTFWRKGTPELNIDGSVKRGGMYPHQLEWWHLQTFIKALVTGYGGGKTITVCKRAIITAMINNGIPNMIVSPSYPQANKTVVYTIEELLDGRGIRYKYNAQKHEFKFREGKNSGLIWIGSGEIPKSLKGPNLGCAYIDEPFIQHQDVFDQMIARVRHPAAKIREIGLSGTPEELNWGYDICAGDSVGKYDLGLVQASSKENKALPKQTIDNMCNGYDEKAVEAYVDGKFVSLSTGIVYRSFSSANEIDSIADYPNNLIVGVDFNVDFMSVVIGFEDQHGDFIQFDEFQLKDSDTREAMRELVSRYPHCGFEVYPDSTGGSRSTKGTTDFAIIEQELGDQLICLNYPSRNPPLRDRFNAVNTKMRNSGGRIGYKVTSNCKETIKDWKQITHPYDKYKKTNEPKGRVHLSDAAGYIFHRRYPAGGQPRITIS